MNGRFPIALHIMTLLSYTGEQLSSDYIAGSLNVNPVLVRKALRDLMAKGLVVSKEGKNGGYLLSRSPATISLSEVYRSVKPEAILGISRNIPNPDCPVGRQITGQLALLYQDIERQLEAQLANQSLAEFCDRFK